MGTVRIHSETGGPWDFGHPPGTRLIAKCLQLLAASPYYSPIYSFVRQCRGVLAKAPGGHRMMSRLYLLTAIAWVLGSPVACDRSSPSDLKGQTNTTMTFHGKVIDQDGSPLQGARFEFRVEAYPKDWTFNTRDRDNNVSSASAISDANGLFQFTVTGCRLIRSKAERDGYRHFYEMDSSTRSARTSHYTLIAWSDLWFRADASNPAVFVFVKEGVREVSALPNRGGAESGGGKNWKANYPAWPKKPSLTDVVRRQPSTNP